MLKSGGSILDANPGSDLDAIQQQLALGIFGEGVVVVVFVVYFDGGHINLRKKSY